MCNENTWEEKSPDEVLADFERGMVELLKSANNPLPPPVFIGTPEEIKKYKEIGLLK